MKIFNSILIIVVLSISIISCDSNSQKDRTKDESKNKTTLTEQNKKSPSGNLKKSLSSQSQNSPVVSPVTPSSNVVTTTPAGMNPPHGQPGHDCKIAVGAPLNSSGPQSTSSGQQIQLNQNTKPTTVTPTAEGMNPPHGQPGHDCKIPVGAPLNSAPVK